MDRIKNEANHERFQDIVFDLQKLVQKYDGLHMLVTDDSMGFRDSVAFLLLPDTMTIPKPMMFRLYNMIFAADRTQLAGGEKHYFAFFVENTFEDGLPIPEED